jgi:hypothetical protein
MDIPVGVQRKEFWRKHIEAAENFSGSQAAYCRHNGLVLSQFVYQRGRFLKKKSKFSEVRPTTRFAPARGSKEIGSYPQGLPDPKWLSALIRELSR